MIDRLSIKTCELNIYNIKISILSNCDFTLENLRKDFILYLSLGSDAESANIRINIYKEKSPYSRIPAVEVSLYGRGFMVYRDKKKGLRYIDYGGKGLMIHSYPEETLEIYSEDENLLYEKSRLAILSRVGELLDDRHLHRLHAVGFSNGSGGTICLLPMEAGKTTLAMNILKKDDTIKLLSEDVCFIDFKSHAYPFMLRIGVRDKDFVSGISREFITEIDRSYYGTKYLVDSSYFKDRISGKEKIKNILIGKRVFQNETEIKRLSRLKCLGPFVQSGVFGLGLPQIVELFLRGGFFDVLRKIGIVFSRSLAFLILICRADIYEIKIGRRPGHTTDELIKFIKKN